MSHMDLLINVAPLRDAAGRLIGHLTGGVGDAHATLARSVTELAPNRVLLMPDGVFDYWSDDFLDLVELA